MLNKKPWYGKYPSKRITCVEACNGSPSDSTMPTCNMEPIQPGSFSSGTQRNQYPVQIMASNLQHGTGYPDLGQSHTSRKLSIAHWCSDFSAVGIPFTGALPLLLDMPHLKSTRPSVCLQSSDREINCLSKMDGSWSDMPCVGTWFRWWALFRKLSTHLWTQADTIVVAGINIVNSFRQWRI